MRRILGPAKKASLYITELAFNHPKLILHLRTYLRFDLFDLALGLLDLICSVRNQRYRLKAVTFNWSRPYTLIIGSSTFKTKLLDD